MTTNVPTQSIDTLNGLVKVCEDGCAGYLKAAELTSDASLKSTFARFGAERGQFAKRDHPVAVHGDGQVVDVLGGVEARRDRHV